MKGRIKPNRTFRGYLSFHNSWLNYESAAMTSSDSFDNHEQPRSFSCFIVPHAHFILVVYLGFWLHNIAVSWLYREILQIFAEDAWIEDLPVQFAPFRKFSPVNRQYKSCYGQTLSFCVEKELESWGMSHLRWIIPCVENPMARTQAIEARIQP